MKSKGLSRHALHPSPLPSCTTGILTINQMDTMEAGSFHADLWFEPTKVEGDGYL